MGPLRGDIVLTEFASDVRNRAKERERFEAWEADYKAQIESRAFFFGEGGAPEQTSNNFEDVAMFDEAMQQY